nr:glycosyltransferase [Clostridia bacterium]
MNAKISVIVPFYCTQETYFMRCMKSLLAEPITDIEIIIIDDGSPSEYLGIMKKFEADERVRIIHAPHAGVSSARNRGIQEAGAKWVMFVDSDDYVSSNSLQIILNDVEQYKGDVHLFGGGLDSQGSITSNTSFLKENHDYGSSKKEKIAIMESALTAGLLPEHYVQKFSYGAPYCKLFRREFLIRNELRFDEGVKFAEDTLFLLSVFQSASSIYFHDLFLYYYVDNVESATRKFRPGLSNDMDVFFERIWEFICANNLTAELGTAYYLRAQLEIGRVFSLEFFNPRNRVRNKKKEFKNFIGKEPYKTALAMNYLPGKSIKKALFWFVVKRGYGSVYRIAVKLV